MITGHQVYAQESTGWQLPAFGCFGSYSIFAQILNHPRGNRMVFYRNPDS